MRKITNLLLAIPIGVIYNMIVHELSNVLNDKSSYKNKVQKSLLLLFGGGLFGFVVAMFMLSGEKNSPVRYGLLLGSALLFIHSVMYNWKIMQNDTRIIIMTLTLFTLIWYSYSNEYKKPKGKKIAKFVKGVYDSAKNENENEDEDEDDELL